MTKKVKVMKESGPVRIYLGRQNVPEGFTKASYDANSIKWNHKADSVDEVICEHIFHLVPGPQRGQFMDDLCRILKSGGKVLVTVPYYSHMRAVQDFMHAWPPVCEASFLYFNKQWREVNKIEYPMTCDFDFTYGYQADPETATKNDETRNFWIKHYTNAVTDLQVALTKK